MHEELGVKAMTFVAYAFEPGARPQMRCIAEAVHISQDLV